MASKVTLFYWVCSAETFSNWRSFEIDSDKPVLALVDSLKGLPGRLRLYKVPVAIPADSNDDLLGELSISKLGGDVRHILQVDQIFGKVPVPNVLHFIIG